MMKNKKKFAFSTLAAVTLTASFGMLTGALVACSDTDEQSSGVYTITFDANGGSFADNKTTVTLPTANGKLASLPVAPEYDGYVFDGYTVEKNGTSAFITLDTVFDGNKTVYAQWSTAGDGGSEFTVTFDANGGEFVDGAVTSLTTVNGKLSAFVQSPHRDDYTFNGWYLTAVCDGDEVTLDYTYTKTTTLYADWAESGEEAPVGYKVTFNGNGGYIDGNGKVTVTTDADGKLAELPTADYRLGYEFVGWFTAQEGGTQITLDKVFDGATDVYAQYNPVQPVASITVGGSTQSMTDNTDNIDKNESPTQVYEFMYLNVPMYAGDTASFKVDGRAVSVFVNATGDLDYSVIEEAISEVTAIADGYYDLYLKYWNSGSWTVYGKKVADFDTDEVGVQTITLDAGEGSIEIATIETNAFGRINPLPTPVAPDGMVFDGWYTAAEDGVLVTTSTIFESATTIYARYVPAPVAPEFEFDNTNTDSTFAQYVAYDVELKVGDVLEFYIDGEDRIVHIGNGSTGMTRDEHTTKISVTRAGTYTLYVKNYYNNTSYWELYATDGVDVNAYYLVGTMSDSNWVWSNAYKFINDYDNYGNPQHELTVYLEKDTQVRMWKCENEWQNNLVGTADGNVTLSGDNMIIGADGWYTFFLNASNEIYVVYSATDPNAAPEITMTVGGVSTTLTLNEGDDIVSDAANLIFEYTITVDLKADDVVAFARNGESLTYYVDDVHGVTSSSGGFTVRADGTFTVYVRYYGTDPVSGDPPCWVIGMTDGKTDELYVGSYYMVGTASGWNALEMYELVDGSITIKIEANEQFQIVQYASDGLDWNSKHGYSHIKSGQEYAIRGAGNDYNIQIIKTGVYTITRSDDGEITITSDEITIPEVTTYDDADYPIHEYYLTGSMVNVNWDMRGLLKLEQDGTSDIYTITIALSAGDSIKVRGNDGSWSYGNDYAITQSATYTITYNSSTYGLSVSLAQ